MFTNSALLYFLWKGITDCFIQLIFVIEMLLDLEKSIESCIYYYLYHLSENNTVYP